MNRLRKLSAVLAAVPALGMAGSALAAGELVWWKFDESSGTTASDSSGNSNAGTLTNMGGTEWTAGKLNNCLNFDGSNDYVLRSALSSSISGDCTVSLWMNRSGGLPSSTQVLTDLAVSSDSGMLVLVRTNGTAFIDNWGGLSEEVSGTQNLCDGSWHHVAAVRAGTTYRLYVDGALVGSSSHANNTAPAYTRLAVAGLIGGGAHFGGKLDDVRVYSTALSGADIQALYNGVPVTAINIWWKFDESSGTTASDSSGNNNAGTLTNMGGTEWTAGKLNNSLNFDGSNDYVLRSALSSSITGDCTVSLWMNRSVGLPSSTQVLTDLAVPSDSGMLVAIKPSTGAAIIDNWGGLSEEVSGTQNLCDGSWHHVAAVRAGTTYRLYVDGALVGSSSHANNTAPAYTRLAVAGLIGGGAHFGGKLDDVRVYSTALSGTEIQALYNSVPVTAISIGGRLELFVDNYLIQSLSNAKLRLHQPMDKGPVFSFDTPWEGNYSYAAAVVKDGNRFFMYSTGLERKAGDPMQGVSQFAFPPTFGCRMSSDGIKWEIPSFGLVSFNGSTDNPLIWTNEFGSLMVAPNDKPDASAQERFIGLLPRMEGQTGYFSTCVSPDGVNFTTKKARCIDGIAFDALGVLFWDSNIGQYAAYTRVWYNPVTGERGIPGMWNSSLLRWNERRLSVDLVNFSAPELLSFRDASGNTPPAEELYTFPVMLYPRAPHIRIAVPGRYMATRKPIPAFYRNGVNDVVFLTSRDGVVWDRTFMEAFIRPGLDRLDWTSKAIWPLDGHGVVMQTGPNELSVYCYDRVDHGETLSRVVRGTLRLDGFVSVRAEAAAGEMITKPITFTGSRLVLNHVTAATGSVRVEIQDANGTPIPGYALANSTARTGDNLEETMSWTGGSDISALAGTPIRLRFVLQDSDVYTMQFTN